MTVCVVVVIFMGMRSRHGICRERWEVIPTAVLTVAVIWMVTIGVVWVVWSRHAFSLDLCGSCRKKVDIKWLLLL